MCGLQEVEVTDHTPGTTTRLSLRLQKKLKSCCGSSADVNQLQSMLETMDGHVSRHAADNAEEHVSIVCSGSGIFRYI